MDTQTHRTTTVTLLAHVRRGLTKWHIAMQHAQCVTIFSTGSKVHPVSNVHRYTLLLKSPVLMRSYPLLVHLV